KTGPLPVVVSECNRSYLQQEAFTIEATKPHCALGAVSIRCDSLKSYLPSKPTKEKGPPMLLKYVSQRSLTVLTFIALAVVGSVGNKSFDKRKSGLSTSVSISQSRAHQRYLS